MNDLPPEFVPSFARLAVALKVSRGWLHDIRLRDSRFPACTPAGWPVYPVAHFLYLRELEKQTDADFNAERREGARETLRQIEAGERPELNFAVAIKTLRSIAAGRWEVDPARGETLRESAIHGCLEGMTFFGKPPKPTPGR